MKSKSKSRVHPECASISSHSTTTFNFATTDTELETSPISSMKLEQKRLHFKTMLEECLSNLKTAIDTLYESHIAEQFAKAQNTQDRIKTLNTYVEMLEPIKKLLSEMEEIIYSLYISAKLPQNEDQEKLKAFVKDCVAIVRETEGECADLFESTSFAHMERMIMVYKLDRRYLDMITVDFKRWGLNNAYQLKLMKEASKNDDLNSSNSSKCPIRYTDFTDGDAVQEEFSKSIGLNSKNHLNGSFKSLNIHDEMACKLSQFSPRVDIRKNMSNPGVLPEKKKSKNMKKRCFFLF